MKPLLLALALSLGVISPAAAQTVILVRHAEKADASADPLLSPAGQLRAIALAEAVGDANVGHIITSPLQRTGLTAAPTAERSSAIIDVASLDGGSAAHVADVAARVRTLPRNAVVLVVGHSNTIPLVARALGFAAAADMPECEYDRLTVLELDGHRTSAIVGSYGAPSVCS
jgi:broad specificity phosphatase PhoE